MKKKNTDYSKHDVGITDGPIQLFLVLFLLIGLIGLSNSASYSSYSAPRPDFVEEVSVEDGKGIVQELLAEESYGKIRDAGPWRWVNVVNPESIIRTGYGDVCGLGSDDEEVGGTIQERGKYDGRILYEYTTKGDPLGTPCPSGVLFFNN